MKIYISADMEGVCGVTTWSEVTDSHADYPTFQKQMTAEVAATCEGAVAAGARQIFVRDAHGPGRNILGAELPREASLIRAWSGHPFCMVQELDSSFNAAMFVGYHARMGAGGNPLAHTMAHSRIAAVRINGTPASEYLIHAYAAATVGVPVVFVSGDEAICEEVKAFSPSCSTFGVKRGEGASTISLHPAEAVDGIRKASEAALDGNPAAAKIELADEFELQIDYKDQVLARQKSFYPGARLISPATLAFESSDYFDLLRALQFVL